MTYELWSGPSGSLLGAFSSEAEAFDAVRRAGEQNGFEYVESLAVVVEDDSGRSQLVAEGRDLVRRVGSRPATAR